MPSAIDEAPDKPSVLIVDDDRGPRESMQIILESDYTTYPACSVDEALQVLEDLSPDCIIMDLKMPGRDGLDGLAAIRKKDCAVSVIMCTAHATLESAQQAIRLRANDYIRKPFSSDELLKAVEDQVSRTRLKRAHYQAVSEVKDIEGKLAGEISEVGMAASALVHDLRNPLTSLLGSVYLLDEELRDEKSGGAPGQNENVQEYMRVISDNLRTCRQLTDNWKSLTNTKSMNWEQFEVKGVVDHAVAYALSKGQLGNRSIETSPPELPVTITADRDQFERLIANLFVNAVQATDADTGSVALQWAEVDGEWVFSIQDNGIGIPPDQVSRVTEPFYTQGKEDGSGLGLFIVRRIVGLHEGTLDVESKLGEGTTFTVKIPLNCSSSSPDSA